MTKDVTYWVIRSPSGQYARVKDGVTPRLYKSEGLANRSMSRWMKLDGWKPVPVKITEVQP